MNTQMQNKRGEWAPSVPVPFYGIKKACSCGKKFWTIDGYNGHYAYHHILLGEYATPNSRSTKDE